MNSIIIESYYFLILLVLGYMAYQDIETRNVSNIVILVFYGLLPPAVTMNMSNLTIYHGVIVLSVVGLYLAHGMGGADMKVLVPLILTLNEGMLYLFLLSIVFIALFIALFIVLRFSRDRLNGIRRDYQPVKFPGMVAICAGYGVVFLLGMV